MINVIDVSPEQFALSIAKNTAALHQKGILVYRRNLLASASRALEISFPTLSQLLGTQGTQALAALYYDDHPLHSGDWGEWGEHLANWLSQQEILYDIPYLADVARLDWLCHSIERSETPENTAESISMLDVADSNFLLLKLTNHLAVMVSRFPILEIWQAHHAAEKSRDYWLSLANRPLTTGSQQYLLITREHWRATPITISSKEYWFYQTLLHGKSLANALAPPSNNNISESPWLTSALQRCLAIGFSYQTALGEIS
jgi:hypothetical protein